MELIWLGLIIKTPKEGKMEATKRKNHRPLLDFKSPAFLDKFEVIREVSHGLEVFAVYYGDLRVTEYMLKEAAHTYVAKIKNEIKSC